MKCVFALQSISASILLHWQLLQEEKGMFSVPAMKGEHTFHFSLLWHCNICLPYACIGWKHRTFMSNHLKAAPLRKRELKRSRNQQGINLKLRYSTCTASLSLPTPVYLTHWCDFSHKVHSLKSPVITLFLILHRWWSHLVAVQCWLSRCGPKGNLLWL